MTGEHHENTDWPLRPWLLAGMLGIAGLLIYHIGGGEGPDTRIGWKAAVSAFLFFGPLAFAFTLERDRWKEPLAFALLAGLVMAGLAWRAVGQAETIADPQYGFLAGVIATGLALPLFQAGFHRTRWATPYRTIHGHVWSDAICAAGSLAFVGASWLMLVLLSELFHLLKIDILKNLIDDGWFGWSWSGAAYGAALGVLRNELGIIGTLRRVVMTVLSLLAVPLAAGLALFLVAMVVSGPQVLWEATRSATPVLLSCAAGAWVLANAILRDEDASMSRNRVLHIAGLVLVLAILPLTIFAAVSMGTRIAQHGLSPERLWGLVAIAVAVAYGLAWLVAVARGWKAGEWRERVRRANLHLAVVICGVALFLALPILDFGAISARQQIARLNSGAVSAEDFDYEALRWDFGAAGRRALARLERSGNPAIAASARSALASSDRYQAVLDRESRIDQFRGELAVYPQGAVVPKELRRAISKHPYEGCRRDSLCRVYLQRDGRTAVVLNDPCGRKGRSAAEQTSFDSNCSVETSIYVLTAKGWGPASSIQTEPTMSEAEAKDSIARERAAIERADVTIGPAPLEQIFIGGKPVGNTYPRGEIGALEGSRPPR